MEFPWHLSFKIMAIARQITVSDANQALICYVKQKAFTLKESITIFADVEQTRPLFTINADRVLDFNANYTFANAAGEYVGSIRRQGARSLWKAHYDVYNDDVIEFTITEANPWTKVLDSLLREVPVVGMFGGYFFHPAYNVTRPDGQIVMVLQKKAAFLEGKFEVTKQGELSELEEVRLLLATIMTVLLERTRG